MVVPGSKMDKTSKFEYRIRFDSSGMVGGESAHPGLGDRLGITLETDEEMSVFAYVRRLAELDANLPDRLARRLTKLLERHEEFSLSGDFQRNGAQFHLHISGRVTRLLNGQITFTLLFLDDSSHTQLRRLYEYMFRLANHEIKGPLACIQGAADLAGELVAANRLEGVGNCIEMIQRNAAAMEEMLTRYLNLSRIESGALQPEPVDIRISEDMLNRVQMELQHDLRKKGMQIEYSWEGFDREPTVYADPEMLFIVLRNLISNAVKYGDAHSMIRVSLREENERFVLSVENEGPNIPQHYLDKLFQKFVRLDATQGTKGSGLGLYNSRKIVELWGGELRVRSSDSKTEFSFTLPELE